MPLLAANWLRHQRRDDFWKHGSVCENFADIEAAVFAVGGWADAYSNAVPRLLAGLTAPRIGLVGPWVHKYPHIASPAPAIGFLQEMLRWWDHWLKGQDSGIMEEPTYRAYMLDSVRPAADHAHWPGRWVAEPAWPSPNVTPMRYALNPGRIAAQGDAGPEAPLTLCSPQTTGLYGGRFCAGMRQGHEFATDQRDDDGGALVFDSDILPERVEILGAPAVELELASDRPCALVALRLSEVHPDGAVTRVCYGVLNLTHRDGHGYPVPLEPGRRFRVRVQLNHIAYAFPPGHRIRLAVSTAYWPLVWPSPERATVTLYAGASRLELPVRPPRQEVAPRFEAPEGAPPMAYDGLEPETCSRTIERDMGRGAVTLRTDDDDGLKRIKAHGLEAGSRVVESFTIAPEDPLSARAEAAWTFHIGRGDWRTRTEGRTVMWSDRESFYLEAKLEAFESKARRACSRRPGTKKSRATWSRVLSSWIETI
jgi:predicted acyl esterase